MFGDLGADQFVFSDPVQAGEVTHIADFDASEDSILLIYNDSDWPEAPVVEVEADPNAPAMTRVFMDGQVVASVHAADGLSIEHIALVPENAAMAAGFI